MARRLPTLVSNPRPVRSRGASAAAPIWSLSGRARGQRVRRVCEALERRYGRPRLGNPRVPVDDLVYVMLSNRTLPEMAKRIYRTLKDRYASWEAVLDADPQELRACLAPAGLSNVKSAQLFRALAQIEGDFGRVRLGRLRRAPAPEVEAYLVELPGVSRKVAKCVMMYTLGFPVLPVDVHVHRIATRLGWTRRKRADQCHDELESLVPENRRYAFHVDCVVHGRAICTSQAPRCTDCCVRYYCEYYKAAS